MMMRLSLRLSEDEGGARGACGAGGPRSKNNSMSMRMRSGGINAHRQVHGEALQGLRRCGGGAPFYRKIHDTFGSVANVAFCLMASAET